jgi:putative ABC transport system ATP-binding protein
MPKKDREDFVSALEKLDLGLEERLSSKVGLLSGGQRQAITLLMATLNRPELLLLDEHTAALDPKTAEKVLKLTKQVVEDGNITTLMITHNMQDAINYGNRLIMMNAGTIIYDVSGEEKKNLTVKALLEKFEEIAPSVVASDKMVLAAAKEDKTEE